MRTSVLLSLQRALLGAVTPNMRAICVGWDEKLIRIRAIYDGEIDDEDRERFSEVGTKVIADFSAPMAIEEECVRLDPPERLVSLGLKEWVYWRYEPSP